MAEDISLWTHVIVAHLPVPHTCRQACSFSLDIDFNRIDDIRVKTKHWEATRRSKYVEASIMLEIIVLFEDSQHNTSIISQPYLIKERIDWAEVDKESLTKDVSYVLQIEDFKWDADLINNEIVVKFTVTYTVNEIREQAVRLHMGSQAADEQESHADRAAIELRKMQSVNDNLMRRLGYYQKDVLSLQHGIKKVEERNAQLNRELNGTREKVQQLQEAITRKDLMISKYKLCSPLNQQSEKLISSSEGDLKIGQRLKRLLLSCF